MTAQTDTVPDLRFPSFEQDWEIKRLGDLCSTFKSGSEITSSEISDEGDFPVYGGNGLRGYTDSYTHEGFYFLIGRQGALCGNINRVRNKSFISEHAIAVQGNEEADTEWLAQRLDYSNLNRLSESSAQPGLSVGKLARLKITVPTLPEQRKIADFLTAVDGRIGQLIQKKALLEDYKKGVMQQLFTQAIRFKDDHGNDFPDWEEKKLGEVGNFRGGGTPATGNESYWRGNIPWISSSDISDSSITQIKKHRFITKDAINESATKLVPSNSILFISRVGVGKLAVSTEEVCTSQDFSNFTPIEDHLMYLSYYFVFNQNLLKRYAQGTSIQGITTVELKKIAIKIPTLDEQTKIADFLSAIDRKVESVATQITETQTFKRGLLQQMFV